LRIVFVLTSEFPAEKAYGITTKKSMLACSDLTHEVFSISLPVSITEDLSSNFVQMVKFFEKNMLINFFLKISYLGYSNISNLSWILMEKFLIRSNKKNLKNLDADLFWCRDPKVALLLLKIFPLTNVVLEIHDPISPKVIKKIQQQKIQEKLILAPINSIISKSIISLNKKFKIVEAPMSIDSLLLQNSDQIQLFVNRLVERKKNNNLEVGYIGKFFPSGISKGYEDIINLALFNKVKKLHFKIQLIGGTTREVTHAGMLINDLGMNNMDINLGPHLPHDAILEFAKSLDVMILPKPRDTKYFGTPLKALESCALGRVVVAADCPVNRALFGDREFIFWYESENISSLIDAIERAVNDESLELKIEEEVKFASLHTWEKRVSQVLMTLD